MRSTAAPAPGATRLTVDVIGHQWFWEVRYPGTPGRHGERDPHPGADAGRRGRHDRRRDPQLLGAAAEPEDRHDPGPARTECCSRPTAPGRYPRPVLRVLRAPARAHGAARDRRAARAVPRVARERGDAGARTRRRPRGAAGRTSSGRRPAPTATRSAARRRDGAVGPDLTHVGSRQTLAAAHAPQTTLVALRLDRATRSTSSRADGCPRSRSPGAAARARRLPGEPAVTRVELARRRPSASSASSGSGPRPRRPRLADDHRPQADRPPLPLHDAGVLRRGRRRGADDAHAARRAERAVSSAPGPTTSS